MQPILPPLQLDGYKLSHPFQHVLGVTMGYNNFTPRSSRVPGSDHVLWFGIQYFVVEYMIHQWNEYFFKAKWEDIEEELVDTIDNYCGPITLDHIKQLHDLGYLPIELKSLPEGMLVPIGVPCLTMKSTHEDFAWLPNSFETILSDTVWFPATSATTAFRYRQIIEELGTCTGADTFFLNLQAHDFSMRGHSSFESACTSGSAHLSSFFGTDTVPVIPFVKRYYNATNDNSPIALSVPATEHAIMSENIEHVISQIRKEPLKHKWTEDEFREEAEYRVIKRLITVVYPTGILSIVCDTFDFWRVVTKILPRLKDIIMARDGKVVIRPDSGDPEKILCGYEQGAMGDRDPEYMTKGLIQCLYDTFGGPKEEVTDENGKTTTVDLRVNSKGYKQLDPHIGAIYGDSITFDRANSILTNLKEQGFASDNVVFGVGSFTYQYVTRDTYGWAMKATYCEVHGRPLNLFKDPKTDDGTKKSAKGLLRVDKNEKGTITLFQNQTKEQEKEGLLETIFLDGELLVNRSLDEIRERVKTNL